MTFYKRLELEGTSEGLGNRNCDGCTKMEQGHDTVKSKEYNTPLPDDAPLYVPCFDFPEDEDDPLGLNNYDIDNNVIDEARHSAPMALPMDCEVAMVSPEGLSIGGSAVNVEPGNVPIAPPWTPNRSFIKIQKTDLGYRTPHPIYDPVESSEHAGIGYW